MTEVEIESLLVRLTGNSDAFVAMLNDAAARTKQFGQTVVSTMASVAEMIGLKSSTSAFSDYQDNLARLEVAVKANGLAVQETMGHYKKFADEIEATTRVSSTMATDLLAVAASYDMVGEKAEKAVRTAIGIAQGRKGVSPQEVLRALSMFQRSSEMKEQAGVEGGSNYGMYYLARILGLMGRGMGGGGRGGGNAGAMQAQMMKEINKQLDIALEVSNKLGTNFGGSLAKINNFLADIRVQLGAILAEWMKPFVDNLNKVVHWFKELDPATKKIITAFLMLGTIVGASGPIAFGFSLIMKLATSMNPIVIALTAVAGATAVWIKYVGGLAAAWEMVRVKIMELGSIGLQWLTDFISNNRQLVLALGLATATIAAVVLAWKALSTAIVILSGLMSVLYIRQLAQIAIWGLWRAAILAAHIVMLGFSTIMAGAGLVASLVRTTIALIAQIAVWTAWKTVVALAFALIVSWNLGSFIISLIRFTAVLLAQIVIFATWGSVLLAAKAVQLLFYASTIIVTAGMISLIAVWASFKFAVLASVIVIRATIIMWNALVAAASAIVSALYGLMVAVAAVGTVLDALNSVKSFLGHLVDFLPTVWNAFTRSLVVTSDAVKELWDSLKTGARVIKNVFFSAITVINDTYNSLKTVVGVAKDVWSAISEAGSIILTNLGSGSFLALAGAMFTASGAGALLTAGLNILGSALAMLIVVVGAGILVWGVYIATANAVTASIAVLTTTIGGLVSTVVAVGSALAVAGAAIGLTAWAGLVAIFSSIKSAGKDVLDTMLGLIRMTGPVEVIGSMLQDWGTALYGAYKAASILPDIFEKSQDKIKNLTEATQGTELAWEILVAGFNVAIEQIKALWPPLKNYVIGVVHAIVSVVESDWNVVWATIQDSALETWEDIKAYAIPVWRLIKDAADNIWEQLVSGLKGAWGNFLDDLAGNSLKAFTYVFDPANWAKLALNAGAAAGRSWRKSAGVEMGNVAEDAKKAQTELDKILGRTITPERGASVDKARAERKRQLDQYVNDAKEAVTKAAAEIDRLQAQFKGVDNERIRAAKEELNNKLAALGILLKTQADEAKKATEKVDLGKPFESATKEIKKWEAALLGSAEAYAHWFDYIDKLNEWEQKQGSLSPYRSAANREGPEKLREPKQIIEGGGKGEGAGAGGGGGIGGANSEKVTTLLQKLVDIAEKQFIQDRKPLPRDVKITGIGPARFHAK